MTHQSTIFLQPRKKGIAAFRERKTLAGRAVKVITSTKTTLALGATLAALLSGGALAPLASRAALRATPGLIGRGLKGTARFIKPKSVKGAAVLFLGVPTAIGVLSSSRKARKIAKSALDPREAFKRGGKIGDIIEDPSKAADILGITKELTAKEKIVAGLKAGGKAGAIIAGGLIGVAAFRKGKQILAKRKAQKLIAPQQKAVPGLQLLGVAEPRRVGLGGIPVSGAVAPSITPTGAPRLTNGVPPIANIIQITVR